MRLAKSGLYATTEKDQLAIDAFESLVCASNLFEPIDAVHNVWPWNEIIRGVADETLKARVLDDLEKLGK